MSLLGPNDDLAEIDAVIDEAMRRYGDRFEGVEFDPANFNWPVRMISATHQVMVTPLLYTAAILVGRPGVLTYDDRWCYHSPEAAMAAAKAWEGPWPGSEPTGWHRHPATGRRRDDGQAASEYVRW
jgi:hypothetical protein